MPKNRSLRKRLLIAFIGVTTLAVILLTTFLFFNSSILIRKNMSTVIHNSLLQTKSNVDILLDSYEDIIYQLYTDDSVVELVDQVNKDEDTALSINQLKRKLRAVENSKKYIESITVITENHTIVSIDDLTSVTTENSWLDSFSLSEDQLYKEISGDNQMHIFSTEYAATFAGKPYYLFHIAHRIIDYRHILSQIGVVIISVDEELLNEACQGVNSDNESVDGMTFIVDQNGRILSFKDQTQIQEQLILGNQSLDQRKQAYKDYILEEGIMTDDELAVDVEQEEDLGWDFVNVSDQRELQTQLNEERQLVVVFSVLCFAILTAIAYSIIRKMTRSLDVVVSTMRSMDSSNMTPKVDINEKMPLEIALVAETYNTMMNNLEASRKKEKKALDKQKDAEIRALEAQINPHFLYNTLDTINWMAIDRENYEISNAISALAVILRYAIDSSNKVVPLHEEIEWLKKYMFLQQIRMKQAFSFDIEIEEGLLELPIHKLLLQPFVENAVIHGFEEKRDQAWIQVRIKKSIREKGWIAIEIIDNGKGMPKEMVEAFNHMNFQTSADKYHIGMENAISRLGMYYGQEAKIHFESRQGFGTTVAIQIKTWEA